MKLFCLLVLFGVLFLLNTWIILNICYCVFFGACLFTKDRDDDTCYENILTYIF